MNPASTFRRLAEPARPLTLTWEGREIAATPGETVAAALLAAGITAFRETPATGAARGPFCLMGACHDCLVEIDGIPNRQACMEPVAEGMTIRRQRGAAEVTA